MSLRLASWAPAAAGLLGVYAVVRTVALVADLLAAHVGYGGQLSGPLVAWDGHFYLQVAAHGYPATSLRSGGQLTYSPAGFEPAYPALIWLFTPVTASATAAAWLVSLLGGAAGTLAVWRLGVAVADETVGWWSGVLFAVFPGMGVVWGILYCECVGLAFAAAALLALVRHRWVWAGVAGGLASFTSPLGLAVVPAALAAGVAGWLGPRPRPSWWGPPVAAGLGAGGFLAYVGFLAVRYHDLFYWWHLQRQAWGARVDFGRSLVLLLPHFFAGGYQGKAWLEWIGVVAVAGAVVALVRARLPAALTAYVVAVLLMLFVSNSLGFKPRLLTWAFPALVAVAATVRGRPRAALALGFAGLLPLVLLAYTLLGNTMVQP